MTMTTDDTLDQLDPSDAAMARRLADVLYEAGIAISDETAIACARQLNGSEAIDLTDAQIDAVRENLNR